MNKNRYVPIKTADLGIDSPYEWTIWDNEKQIDLYHEWVFNFKKDAKQWCEDNN